MKARKHVPQEIRKKSSKQATEPSQRGEENKYETKKRWHKDVHQDEQEQKSQQDMRYIEEQDAMEVKQCSWLIRQRKRNEI